MNIEQYNELWNTCQTIGMLQDHWELKELINMLGNCHDKKLLEIGMYKGGTAYVWLTLGMDVVSIDPSEESEKAANELNMAFGERFKFVRGGSQSQEIQDTVRGTYDILFIDGDHSPVASMADFVNYKGMVKAGGLVIMHDIIESEYFNRNSIRVCETWRILKRCYRHKEIVSNEDPVNGSCGFGIIYL